MLLGQDKKHIEKNTCYSEIETLVFKSNKFYFLGFFFLCLCFALFWYFHEMKFDKKCMSKINIKKKFRERKPNDKCLLEMWMMMNKIIMMIRLFILITNKYFYHNLWKSVGIFLKSLMGDLLFLSNGVIKQSSWYKTPIKIRNW
jgi:hypothetical protein